MAKEIEKVLAYITRMKDGRTQVLVFEHRDHPEAGVQVPAGTVDASESIETAVIREVQEEAGIFLNARLQHLGRFKWFREDRNEFHLRNVFHVQFDESLKDEWQHEVSGSGEDHKLIFQFYWEDVEKAKSVLAVDQGKYLDLLE